MNKSTRCPKCGIQLTADAPAGLCPKCLVQAGFESQPVPHVEPGPTKPTPPASGFVPPSVEYLGPLFPQLTILELLGQGGMGAVYKARQPGLDRLVALKILPPEISRDPAFAERFQREARALARLSHPHIVAVYDFGQTDSARRGSPDPAARSPEGLPFSSEPQETFGQPGGSVGDRPQHIDRPQRSLCYIVMEFVDGANLRQTIRAGKLAPAEALAIVPQICEALQFAHDEGIVHRDIKPENILIDKRGRVKIADFGLAKLLGQDASDHSLTATHQVMGTLRYMAPEQMKGSREVDHRADIYSLGVVFYELLTGELPMGKFAPPSKRVQVDVRLDEVVLRALEQDPDLRYQHASEVKTDTEIISHSRSAARPESPKGAPTEPHLVQAPADCLLLAAGIAFVTACGVATWLLAVPAYSSNEFTNSMVRRNLIGMSVGLAIYSVFIGIAGLMLRRLRARLAVLLVAVIVGLFFPAAAALNVVMELRNIPQWPVIIPLWLGMPAALWVVVTLFRADVRRAFDAATERRAENTGTGPDSLREPNRVGRISLWTAIVGVVLPVLLALGAQLVVPSSEAFRWKPMPEEDTAGGHRNWSLKIVTDGGGGGSTEGNLLPDELNDMVGARSLGLGVLEPNEEVVHWGIHDVRDLPSDGLIGFRRWS